MTSDNFVCMQACYRTKFDALCSDFVGLLNVDGVFTPSEIERIITTSKTIDAIIYEEVPELLFSSPRTVLGIIASEPNMNWVKEKIDRYGKILDEHDELCYPPSVGSWAGRILFCYMKLENEDLRKSFEQVPLEELFSAFPEHHLKAEHVTISELYRNEN